MTSRSKRDFFEHGKPVHRLSYCAFLDVLGFSARIRESYKTDNPNLLLNEFHSILANCLKELRKRENDTQLYLKSFSDNVLIAHPQFSEDMESEFAFVLWAVQEYQFEMAKQGFFIRGGFSVGPLFMDENSVYGDALISAYELESKIAVNPIVVLCDDTKQLVNAHLKFYEGEAAPQTRSLLIGPDGRYFVNYLGLCILEGDDDYRLDVKSLLTHKDNIQGALKQSISNPAVFSKFVWLAQYHNYFCSLVESYKGYSKSLHVTGHSMKITFNKLGNPNLSGI
jgi:hypothetical protein